MPHTSARSEEVWVDQEKRLREVASPQLRLGCIISFTVLLVGLLLWGYAYRWTGFRDQTLWDWLQLLLAVFVTVMIAYLGQRISQRQYHGQQEAEEKRAQAEALQGYLDQIGQLLLDKDKPLRQSKEGDEVSMLARARTLTALSQLDGKRKGILIRFLSASSR
jgi:hypothetical protein